MTAADTLIDKLILTPDTTAPNGQKLELFGELGAILSLCNDGMVGNAKTRRVTAGLLQMFLVAGVRNRLGLPDRWKTSNPAGKPYLDLLFNAYDVTDVYKRTGSL